MRKTTFATAIVLIAIMAMGCIQQGQPTATPIPTANQTESGKPTNEPTASSAPTLAPTPEPTAPPTPEPTEKPTAAPVKIANPASEYCDALGFSSEIVTAADGSQYGICRFEDGFCDEWKFYRGECGSEQKRKLISEYYASADLGCEKDGDCEKKDMRSCGGYYPMCVNRNVRPAFNELWCQGMRGESGFQTVMTCYCNNGTCRNSAK